MPPLLLFAYALALTMSRGGFLALMVALGVSVAWNAGLYATRHHESFA